MMNILLIVKNFNLGGTEAHVRDLANALHAEGVQLHVAARDGKQAANLHPEIKFHPFQFSELQFLPNVYRLTKLVKEHDIELIHGHQRMSISLAAIVGRLCHIPSVATIHGRLKYDIRSPFIRAMLTHIIAVAPNRLAPIQSNHQLMQKSSVIHNAVVTPISKPASNTTMKGTAEKNSAIRMLYMSRLDRKHGQVVEDLITQVLPKLVQHTPSIELRIAGEGAYLNHIQETLNQAKDNQLKDKVKLLGYVNEPYKEIAAADLVLGVGRVAIESLAADTPVMCVNHDFCGDIITLENYQALKHHNFVPRDQQPYSPEILTQRLLAFLDNRESVLQAHSPVNEQSVAEQSKHDFSQETWIKKTVAVYRAAIELEEREQSIER